MEREQDAIYQNGKIVARAVGAEIDEAKKEVKFQEFTHSDGYLIPEECEYRKYRILIQNVEYATKEGPEAAQKGRILRGLEGDILGYCEQ